MYSVLTGEPATYTIDALEDSELLLLEAAAMEEICRALPPFERFFRLLLQNSYIASQRRISAGLSLSAEEQYLRFVKMYPAIANRVPLKDIASYLGITPQSLSRIRRDLARNA
jgi:CRP-like cAMP-binding protein